MPVKCLSNNKDRFDSFVSAALSCLLTLSRSERNLKINCNPQKALQKKKPEKMTKH